MPLLDDLHEALFGRLSGPMHMRFFMQPTLAIGFAIRDALRDAREGKPALFVRALRADPAMRAEIFKDAWRSISRVFFMAFVLDIVYELSHLHTLHPVVSLVIAAVCSLLPYLVTRHLVRIIVGSRLAEEPH